MRRRYDGLQSGSAQPVYRMGGAFLWDARPHRGNTRSIGVARLSMDDVPKYEIANLSRINASPGNGCFRYMRSQFTRFLVLQ